MTKMGKILKNDKKKVQGDFKMLSWIRFLSNAAQIWRAAPKVGMGFEFEKSYVDFLNFGLFWSLICFGNQNIRYILLQISSLILIQSHSLHIVFSDCTWCSMNFLCGVVCFLVSYKSWKTIPTGHNCKIFTQTINRTDITDQFNKLNRDSITQQCPIMAQEPVPPLDPNEPWVKEEWKRPAWMDSTRPSEILPWTKWTAALAKQDEVMMYWGKRRWHEAQSRTGFCTRKIVPVPLYLVNWNSLVSSVKTFLMGCLLQNPFERAHGRCKDSVQPVCWGTSNVFCNFKK